MNKHKRVMDYGYGA